MLFGVKLIVLLICVIECNVGYLYVMLIFDK